VRTLAPLFLGSLSACAVHSVSSVSSLSSMTHLVAFEPPTCFCADTPCRAVPCRAVPCAMQAKQEPKLLQLVDDIFEACVEQVCQGWAVGQLGYQGTALYCRSRSRGFLRSVSCSV
jgi:hypothetical protein